MEYGAYHKGDNKDNGDKNHRPDFEIADILGASLNERNEGHNIKIQKDKNSGAYPRGIAKCSEDLQAEERENGTRRTTPRTSEAEHTKKGTVKQM